MSAASIRDREGGFSERVMSVLHPKADMCGATTDVRYGPIADMDSHCVSLSGGFRKACSLDILPHQNQLVFRPSCSPSRDGSRVEPDCSRRRCKQSVAVQQWQPSCDSCGA